MTKPKLEQGVDYERGFIDGMQKQMQSSVDKAVNAMTQPTYYIPNKDERTWVGLDWLPKHRCGLHLSHNEHRDVYETVEDFYDIDSFISMEELAKAISEDSVWVLHWYPETPIGFHRIAASTLEAIEAKLKEKNNG